MNITVDTDFKKVDFVRMDEEEIREFIECTDCFSVTVGEVEGIFFQWDADRDLYIVFHLAMGEVYSETVDHVVDHLIELHVTNTELTVYRSFDLKITATGGKLYVL